MIEFIVIFKDKTKWLVMGYDAQDVRERYDIRRASVDKLYPA